MKKDKGQVGNADEVTKITKHMECTIRARSSVNQPEEVERMALYRKALRGLCEWDKASPREELACLLIGRDPSHSVEDIAKRVGVFRTTPYKWTEFRKVMKFAQEEARRDAAQRREGEVFRERRDA